MPFDTPATENAERHATKLTKRYLAKPFWVLLVPLLFPSALAAEPSLAETVAYIDAKLGSWNEKYIFAGGDITWHMTSNQKTFRLDGRTATYSHVDADSFGTKVRYEYTFQLSALSTEVTAYSKEAQEIFEQPPESPDRIVGVVRVACARGRCISVHTSSVEGKGEKTKGNDQAVLIFRVDPDDVERVQRALTHAIELSGGKDELF